ncbi:hypothetical protein [Streptomyces abyssomicinicus]|uniref:hypothetical protein n=1 Tax=Streptomyces abyssomicinicus TaxID=574929 RepID=UPI001250541E|nr:hypothetical protein [Streptomyces abyssomicinicus]
MPAVCRWLVRGATVVEITDALTQGLPGKVYSVGRLLADRLERKLPAARRRWKSYAECGSPGCGGLLPDGQETGICTGCAVGGVEYFAIDCATGVVTDRATDRGADAELPGGVPVPVPLPAPVLPPAALPPLEPPHVAAPVEVGREAGPVVPDPAGRVAELRALLRGAAARAAT